MTFDDLPPILARCDDQTSRHFPNGARFIRQLPEKGPLAFCHYLPPPANDDVLLRIEAALGRTIPLEFRDMLKRTNGPSLFDKHLSFFGANEGLSRSLRLEDQIAVSLLFENETFSLIRRARWNEGWMKIGVASGWSTQHELQANESGRCAIVNIVGASVEFDSFGAILDFLIEMISPLVPCSGLVEGEYGPLELALCDLFSAD
ncbi:SMI1/KNR4 family protein [Sphingomonas koreensis]|nr:SMI1/KNR4 family protein [Sphingomonas koreensis]